MGLFDKLLKKETVVVEDNVIVSLGTGEIIDASKISDPVFATQMLGKTIGFNLEDGTVVAPANGKLTVMFPTGHAFGVTTKDGVGLLVHIGIDTVNMKGKGFKVYKKQGDEVKAGETVVKVDLETVKNAGYDPVTMLIVTELPEGLSLKDISEGPVKKASPISEVIK